MKTSNCVFNSMHILFNLLKEMIKENQKARKTFEKQQKLTTSFSVFFNSLDACLGGCFSFLSSF